MTKESKLLIFLFFGTLPFQINGLYLPLLTERPFLFWTEEIVAWVLLPALIFAKVPISRKALGFSNYEIRGKPKPILFFIASLVSGAALYGCFRLARAASVELFPVNFGSVYVGYGQVIPGWDDPWLHVLSILFLASTAAIVEEFYCRGLLFALMPKLKRSQVVYVLSSSIWFSLGHWESGARGLFVSFVFGVLACCLYLTWRNLWPLIIGHFIVDLWAFA